MKSRLQFNHVPVHEMHSAMVRKITTTSKTPSLNRIEGAQCMRLAALYPDM